MSTYATSIPGASLYAQAELAAKTAYQRALNRINQQRSGLLRQKGYQADIDPETGTVANLRTDPQNQYGEFQLLNRSQFERHEAARNQALGRGLGAGGGLAAQLRNRARFQSGYEDKLLGEGLTSALGGLQTEQDEAARARNAALYEAQLDAARMAIDSDDFSPPDFGAQYGGVTANPLLPASVRNKMSDALIRKSRKAKPQAVPGTGIIGNFGAAATFAKAQKPLSTQKTAAPARYYTYKKDVPLKPGQTLKYTPGKGYYAG